jgi:cytochrome c oxidase subunit IV
VSAPTTDVRDPQPHEEHVHGPTDKQYFMIFWVLVVLTALEVSTEWWTDWFGEGSRTIAVPLLIFLMVVKFFLVALYFMHLKFDHAILKRIFYFGMVLAIAVYIAALSAMHYWEDSGTTRFDDPPPVTAFPPGGSDAAVEPQAGSGQSTAEGDVEAGG